MSKVEKLLETMEAPASSGAAEVKVVRFHAHGGALIWPFLFLTALAGLAPYLLSFELEIWLQIVLVIAYVLITFIFVIAPFFRWLTNTNLITTERIIVRRGFFVRQKSEVLLTQVTELKLRRSPIQRIFRSGDIIVRTVSGARLILRNVPALVGIADALQEVLTRQSARSNAQQLPPFGSTGAF